MKYDPKFATSPIFIDDKDFEFSINPELITLVESDPFHGYETETVVMPYTCGLSRPFSGTVAESIATFVESLGIIIILSL